MPAPLTDLQAFATVARLRSFRRAATDIGVSPSALSHSLRGLEARLGVRLLNRTTRSVAPTPAGEALLARLAPALVDIEAALEAVNAHRDSPVGSLRINTPRPAARWVLAPLVARFLGLHPGMKVELVCDDALVDIVAAGFDAGVRFGETLQQDMVAVPLGPPQRFVVVASPAYLAAHGRPHSPRDLREHRCICIRFPSGAAQQRPASCAATESAQHSAQSSPSVLIGRSAHQLRSAGCQAVPAHAQSACSDTRSARSGQSTRRSPRRTFDPADEPQRADLRYHHLAER
jgi:DNA-binding transcriptional LysR family regulator